MTPLIPHSALRKVLLLSALLLLFTGLSPAAAFGPLGHEFVVNTTIDGNDGLPAVAIGKTGTIAVVVWQHNQGESDWDIYAQRLDAEAIHLALNLRL
ncbi:MAG: hypothetical protein U0694_05305 [Anaerolineae bacterium]